MIPRKSVIAIIGITDKKVEQDKTSCSTCKNKSKCKFKKGVNSCGN